jgi:hypothetical protein
MQLMKRRQLVQLMARAAGAMVLAEVSPARAQAHVSESDPMAQSLNYRDDATKVDKSNTRYVPGSACANCVLYQGKAGDASGTCPIFQKLVSAKGWCNSYTKKS